MRRLGVLLGAVAVVVAGLAAAGCGGAGAGSDPVATTEV